MNSEELVKLYQRQESDESITPFTDGVGFSLIRFYPKNTPYYRDGRRMFIKIVLRDHEFFYGADMTTPRKRGEETTYSIADGDEYKKKVTNFFSNDNDFMFNKSSKQVIHQSSKKSFTLNEFVNILSANHLSDRLFLNEN
jgi:hypothetical protein